jgi:hypothetical protein
VSYVTDAEPVVHAVCNCTDCQRQTGGPFSVFVAVPQAGFSCQEDTLASFSTTGEDHGGETQRKFCSVCGSPVFSIAAVAPELICIKTGSLDDASWVRPTVEAWISSAQPWSPRFDHVAHLERGPS